jgi:hypothetical protein
MKSHFTAVRAFKRRGDGAGIGQATAFAERRLDEMHLETAARTDKAVPGGGVFRVAKLADLGIKKCQTDLEASLD